MSATAIRAPKSPAGSPMTPLLRAVLLADLVDSTAFIERFGDARAAAALQRLDLQIRDLLGFTGGRLIDKADGLLAIFERPIQAVDFALRYQQLLRQFSEGEAGKLQARVGIHVGELMTWHNDDAAVAAGAKPMEVEGLAKPIAARLMTLALPGQILISSLAQTLAQRAQAELGERASGVRWMVHGRYRFKGVPAPLLVHEVGEIGTSPLRAPPSGQKVWRDVPLWRRPPVLAVELLVFLAVGLFYGYAIFRSPPALGFQERDWIVMGDVSNFTGDPRLEDALESALRISLEQSRYVNLLPDMKVQEVLQRMGRSRQAIVDRAMGSEIAVREGARAVFLPSIADDAGRIRVSMEVVDPSNQVTVFAESAEGRGVGSVMQSLDAVNTTVRERLGESLSMIKATGMPLAKATTSNLDALRAYSLALDTGRAGRLGESMQLMNTAIELDPRFAMAYANRAQLWGSAGDSARALKDYQAAARLRSRMTVREAMVLDVNRATFGPPGPQLEKVRALARMYPDTFNVRLRSANVNWYYLQQYALAAAELEPELRPQNPMLGTALSLAGVLALAQDQYAAAEAAFVKSRSVGGLVFGREYADVFAAQRQFGKAGAIFRQQQSPGLDAAMLDMRIHEITYAADQGRWPEAIAAASALQNSAVGVSREVVRDFAVMSLALSGYSDPAGSVAAWRRLVDVETRHASDGSHPDVFKARFTALYGAGQLARLGDATSAQRTLMSLDATIQDAGYPTLVDLSRILRAEIALARGQPDEAIAALVPSVSGTELCAVHATLLRAYRAARRAEDARAEAVWLATHRGRAYAEYGSDFQLQAVNVAESDLALLALAELAHSAGDDGQSRQALASFDAAWPHPPSFAAARSASLREALETADRPAVGK